MVWLTKYRDKKESDRASLTHSNVELRIAQDGAVLLFAWTKVQTLFIESPFFHTKVGRTFFSKIILDVFS